MYVVSLAIVAMYVFLLDVYQQMKKSTYVGQEHGWEHRCRFCTQQISLKIKTQKLSHTLHIPTYPIGTHIMPLTHTSMQSIKPSLVTPFTATKRPAIPHQRTLVIVADSTKPSYAVTGMFSTYPTTCMASPALSPRPLTSSPRCHWFCWQPPGLPPCSTGFHRQRADPQCAARQVGAPIPQRTIL